MDEQPTVSTAWLSDIGFPKGNPFSTRLLPDEPDRALIQYFVPRAGYSDIVGSAKHPQSAVLIAPRGGGKTTSLRALEALCHAGRLDAPVLPVTYDDFEATIGAAGSPDSVTTAHHVEQILKVGLKALFEAIAARPGRASAYVHGARRKLAAFLLRFTSLLDEQMLDPWLAERGLLTEACNTEALREGYFPPNSPFLELVSGLLWSAGEPAQPTETRPLEWLRGFVELTRWADFESVYILIDGVDEREPMASEPEAAASLLAPLITNLHFLELRYAAFKFFLMPEVVVALRARRSFREDRLVIREISWDEAGLRELLDRRVNVYSDYQLPSLDAVAETGSVVMPLATAANRLPRNALRLGEWLLYCQSRRVGARGPLAFTKEDVQQAIARFAANAQQAALERSEAALKEQDKSTPTIRFDEADEVWVGSKRIGHLPTRLTTLLHYLLANPDRVLSYDQIGTEIHGEDWTASGRTDESIDKLIQRLRARLELGAVGSEVIKKRPQGYVFRRPAPDELP